MEVEKLLDLFENGSLFVLVIKDDLANHVIID